MPVYINQITTAVPSHKYLAEEISLFLANTAVNPTAQRKARIVSSKSGIESRYSVLEDFRNNSDKTLFKTPVPSIESRLEQYNFHSLPLALDAINQLDGFRASDITHILTVSCTGMSAPGLELWLSRALKLNSTCAKHAINFIGCHGAFHAMKIAHSIIKADSNSNVLIVSVELCSLHFQPSDDDDSILANVLFGDGAAAMLLSAKNNTDKPTIELIDFEQQFIPSDNSMMAWNIDSKGFLLRLSSYVPQAIKEGVLSLYQTSKPSDKDLWAIHPGGKNILDSVESALDLSEAQMNPSRHVLKHYGNMSSATIVFVLKEILGQAKETSILHSLGFGPGLTIEKLKAKIHV